MDARRSPRSGRRLEDPPACGPARRRLRAFTLIELLVVLAILALMLTIAAPKYIQHIERAREATLRSSLKVMRDAIDKFYGDQGHWPLSLDELVARNYLKSVPVDPITDRNDTWITLTEAEVRAAAPVTPASVYAPPAGAPAVPPKPTPGIADVHSGAPGNGENGQPFQDW